VVVHTCNAGTRKRREDREFGVSPCPISLGKRGGAHLSGKVRWELGLGEGWERQG
jgi:hypothetical protein